MKKLSILKLTKAEQGRLYGGYSCSAESNYACRTSSCTCREQLFYNNSHFTTVGNDAWETDSAHNHGVYSHQDNPDYITL